jgi:hypothetical protein
VYAQGLADNAPMTLQEASQVIAAAEGSFRRITILYGLALTEPEDVAVGLLAENFASFAVAYLTAMGIPVDPNTDFAPLAEFGIQQGIALCANDFAAEVNATFKFVKKNLAGHKKDR